MFVKLLLFCSLICSYVEVNQALDKKEEFKYFADTVKQINQKYREGKKAPAVWSGELTKSDVVDQNNICGDSHFGPDDPAKYKTQEYLLSDEEPKLGNRQIYEIFSTWYSWSLDNIHNYTYCMQRLLK